MTWKPTHYHSADWSEARMVYSHPPGPGPKDWYVFDNEDGEPWIEHEGESQWLPIPDVAQNAIPAVPVDLPRFVITHTQQFGDVDYGPYAYIQVRVTIADPSATDEDVCAWVWDYYTRNYQDPFQTFRFVNRPINDQAIVNVFMYWGDHHLSEVDGDPDPKVSTR